MHLCSLTVEVPRKKLLSYYSHTARACLQVALLFTLVTFYTQMIMDLTAKDGGLSQTSSCLQVSVNHLVSREFLFQGWMKASHRVITDDLKTLDTHWINTLIDNKIISKGINPKRDPCSSSNPRYFIWDFCKQSSVSFPARMDSWKEILGQTPFFPLMSH